MNGKLYIVATPIGNLEDITLRALRILKEVDVIAAEDTRQTLKLLNHFEIAKPLISYHRHNEDVKTELLIQKLLNGENIALITDAGTPAISDPGELVVKEAIKNTPAAPRDVPMNGMNIALNTCADIIYISSKRFLNFIFSLYIHNIKKTVTSSHSGPFFLILKQKPAGFNPCR